MKQGRALPEVLTELQRQNAAKQDYIGAAEAFRLDEDGSTFCIGDDHSFGTTQLFHRQVASALGIPARYYDMMQKQKPELLADVLTFLFRDGHEQTVHWEDHSRSEAWTAEKRAKAAACGKKGAAARERRKKQ